MHHFCWFQQAPRSLFGRYVSGISRWDGIGRVLAPNGFERRWLLYFALLGRVYGNSRFYMSVVFRRLFGVSGFGRFCVFFHWWVYGLLWIVLCCAAAYVCFFQWAVFAAFAKWPFFFLEFSAAPPLERRIALLWPSGIGRFLRAWAAICFFSCALIVYCRFVLCIQRLWPLLVNAVGDPCVPWLACAFSPYPSVSSFEVRRLSEIQREVTPDLGRCHAAQFFCLF